MPDASARFSAVALVNSRQPRRVQRPVGANGKVQDVGELFGQKTFSLEQMADKLPRPIFKQLAATIEEAASWIIRSRSVWPMRSKIGRWSKAAPTSPIGSSP